MKKFRTIYVLVCSAITVAAVILVYSTFFQAQAAGSASISCGSDNQDVGETFSVKCRYSSEVPMYSFIGTLTYDSDILSYVSGADSRIGNRLKVMPTMNGEQEYEFSVQFKVLMAGNASISFSATASDGKVEVTGSASTVVTCVGESTTVKPVETTTRIAPTTAASTTKIPSTTKPASTTKTASTTKQITTQTTTKPAFTNVSNTTKLYVTPKAPTTMQIIEVPTMNYVVADLENSANADLESLTTNFGTFDKPFNPSNTEYVLTVGKNITEVNFLARASFGATVVGDGIVDLKDVNSKQVAITVTALDGKTKKTYMIDVRKSDAEEEVSSASQDSEYVQVDGKSYYLFETVNLDKIPENCETVTVNYNERPIEALRMNSGVTLCWLLSDDGEGKLFKYIESSKTFVDVNYIIPSDDHLYLVFNMPEKYSDNETFKPFYININSSMIRALADSKTEDPSEVVLYCDDGSGDPGFYWYGPESETIREASDIEELFLGQDVFTYDENDTQQNKKKSKSAIVISICAVIMLALCTTGVVIYKKARTKKEY